MNAETGSRMSIVECRLAVVLAACGCFTSVNCGTAIATVDDAGDASQVADGSVDASGADAITRDATTDGTDDGTMGDATGTDADASPLCNAASCPTGCCGNQTVCNSGSANAACGRSGQTCIDCAASGEQCVGGSCMAVAPTTCTPQNCAGCCEGNTCRAGSDIKACGSNGGGCVYCPLGEACNGGTCAPSAGCDPQNCYGCCLNGTCYVGLDDMLCGQNGDKCVNCNGACEQTGQLGGGACTPIQSPCAKCAGCCDQPYDSCRPGTDNLACGSNGAGCAVCSDGGTCIGNACTFGSCSSANCAGCCDDYGTCQMQIDEQHCGRAGDLCAVCLAGYSCANGYCIPMAKCGPATCAGGCCDESDVCHQGTTDAYCGIGGVACATCSNQMCVMHACQ